VLVLIVVGCGTQGATAGEPGRLAALAARQDLCDEICIARAEGKISPENRYTILADARKILSPEEYAGFRRAFDRIAPPPPPALAKHTSVKRLPSVAQKKSPTTRSKAVAKTLPRPTFPLDTLQPDRVAFAREIR
jgi:hypothetical protein